MNLAEILPCDARTALASSTPSIVKYMEMSVPLYRSFMQGKPYDPETFCEPAADLNLTYNGVPVVVTKEQALIMHYATGQQESFSTLI